MKFIKSVPHFSPLIIYWWCVPGLVNSETTIFEHFAIFSSLSLLFISGMDEYFSAYNSWTQSCQTFLLVKWRRFLFFTLKLDHFKEIKLFHYVTKWVESEICHKPMPEIEEKHCFNYRQYLHSTSTFRNLLKFLFLPQWDGNLANPIANKGTVELELTHNFE